MKEENAFVHFYFNKFSKCFSFCVAQISKFMKFSNDFLNTRFNPQVHLLMTLKTEHVNFVFHVTPPKELQIDKSGDPEGCGVGPHLPIQQFLKRSFNTSLTASNRLPFEL